MASVYLVEHYHPLVDDPSNSKFIGIYTDRERAEAAVRTLAQQPGFRDLPDIQEEPHSTGGFAIVHVELDETNWTEGYVTV